MLKQIHSYRMVNCQSWVDETIELSSSLANILIARSETGKSVLFKMIRQMCFHNFHGRKGRETLISYNKDYAKLFLFLKSGVEIEFTVFKTYQIYKMTKDGEVRTWKQNTLPEEIRVELGWFIDEEYQIIVNLIDLEMPTLFVDSSPIYNARLLRFVTAHPVLEKSIEYLKEKFQESKTLVEAEKTNLRVLEHQNSLYKYRDVFNSKIHLERAKGTLEVFKVLAELHRPLDALVKLEEPASLPSSTLEEDYKTFKTLTQVKEKLELISENIPELPRVDERNIRSLKVLNEIKERLKFLNKDISDLPEVNEDNINLIGNLHEMKNQLESLNDIEIVNIPDIDLTKEIKQIKTLRNLSFKLKELITTQYNLNKATELLERAESDLAQFELCPSCGKPVAG